MTCKILLSLIFSISFAALRAQPFTNINAPLPELGNSCAVWADYDLDGDLDLAITGEPGSTIPKSYIYRNDQGQFVDVGAPIMGVTQSYVDWGDYDNDGDLDLLTMGQNNSGVAVLKLYGNDNGVFTEIAANLPGMCDGQCLWGDYDSDSDLDILVAGRIDGLHFGAAILRNDGDGVFTDIVAHLTGVQSATACWIDYDNDGQLDVLVGGDSGGGMITKLYRNNDGAFTEVNAGGFAGLGTGQIRSGDLDNDGDMDFIVTGMDDALAGHIYIYRNDGDGQFTMNDWLDNNISFTSIDLGDYDNDGYLDIILIGKIQGCGGTAVTMLLHNESFLNFFEVSTLIPGIKSGSATWGDFNNDGYSDLLFTGFDGYDVPVSKIYKNNEGSGSFTVNTPPAAPTGLSAATEITENYTTATTFTWSRAGDAQTPSFGLSYNLYLGTSPMVSDRLAPMSELSTGFRKIVNLGNMYQDTTWTVYDLGAGDFYWSVQSVDNGALASTFAPEQSFTIYGVGITERDPDRLNVYPNPASGHIQITKTSNADSFIEIFDVYGNKVLSDSSGNVKETIDISKLPDGLYIIRMETGNRVSNGKFVKK